MEYVLLALAVSLGAFKNVFTKIVKKKSKDFYATMKMNVITFAFAFVTVFLIGITSAKTFFKVPWELAFFYAICVLGSQISLMKAVELGSVSISSLFYSCGFILPTVFGCIYYKEEVNALHIISLVLIIISFACSAKKEDGKSFNFSWLIAALGGLFFSGMVGIMQKLFSNEYAQYKLDNFLCVSFLFIIAISALAMLCNRIYCPKKGIDEEEFDGSVERVSVFKEYIFTIFLGVVMGLVNKLNTFLSGVLPSILVFPVINGGVILTTALCSKLFFKEKLTMLQKVGLMIGLLGILGITVAKALI